MRGIVVATLGGVLLLALIYWQSVIRGVFLMIVVMASPGAGKRIARLTRMKAEASSSSVKNAD